MLVLGGALAAGHSYRVYDAVVLKTLGATRGELIGAYAIEYLLLGAATALFGVAPARSPAGWSSTELMNLHIRLAAAAGRWRRLWRASGHGCLGPDRHVHRARPEARAGAAQSVACDIQPRGIDRPR